MKDWLTAKELADAHLKHFPSTVRGILDHAAREGWNDDEFRSRKRAGRGGGMEYHIGLLPIVAQVELKQRSIRVGTSEAPIAANDQPASSNLSERAATERDARLAILRAFDLFGRGQRLNKGTTRFLFVEKYNAATLAIAPWVRERVPSISVRSLARWMDEAKRGTDRLAVDKSANRKGKSVFDLANDGQVRVLMLALLADNQHLSAHHIRQLCRERFGETLQVGEKAVPMPPVRTFQHALKTLRSVEKVVLTKIANPDLFRSTMAPAGRGVLRHVNEANALWMIDASPVDALCTDGRHSVYVCIDIATRRIVIHVSKTPRASAVALMIRKAILAFGAPVAIKTDNGSDFVAKDIERLFAHLNIEAIRSNAYSPQEKGHVERVIRTFQHDCATTLPGFVGHSVADRKAIEARKSFAARLGESDAQAFGVGLSGAELQEVADRWVELVYHQRPHEGLQRRSPSLAAAQSATKLRTIDERALDILLLPVATRRVTKFGIRVDGRHYMTPSILPGTDVLVRMDDTDLGLVYAFAADGGEFLGVGICPELSGIAPETAAQAIKAAQREIVERGTAEIKAEIRRLKSGPSYIERILKVAAADMPNVVAMPKRSESHSTPQIEAAIEASGAKPEEGTPLPIDGGRLAETQRRLIAEMDAEDAARSQQAVHDLVERRAAEIEEARTAHLPQTVVALPETPKGRYRRMLLIERAIERGEAVATADAILLGRYQETAEYRGQKAVHDAYGDEYLAL